MIHGAGGGGWEWDFWRETFEQRDWEVLAHDLEPSSKGLAETRLRDYVEQVVAWTAADDRLLLVGASMGGAIALLAAEQLRPNGVVLVNSVVPAAVTSATEGRHALPGRFRA